MGYLIAAAVAPVAGPLLYRALHRHEAAIHQVDAFVYLAVPALVALQVVPHAIRDRSALAFVLLAAGLLVPALFERASRALETHTDKAALAVGLSGLALHALLEGAALPSASAGDFWFGSAIVLHRIPIGLVLWWLVRPRWGPTAAGITVAGLVGVTVVGYAAAGGLVSSWQGAGPELYQAFVGGSLLHVVFHQGRHDHAHGDGHPDEHPRHP